MPTGTLPVLNPRDSGVEAIQGQVDRLSSEINTLSLPAENKLNSESQVSFRP